MRPLLLLLLLYSHPPLFAEEVYRWQDASSQTHFGDAPPEQAINPQSITVSDTNSVYEVGKVIDGDTVALENGPRVRLLGINAPEVPHRDHAGEPFGEEAKARLNSLLKGKRVFLHYDDKRLDRYQRQLAYLQFRPYC